MKEESNIAMGLLTANKWQPAVLQLLPFSNNNVGLKRHVQGLSSATYSESGKDREFPMLAVTRTENAKPRSKSANISFDISSSQVRAEEKKFDQSQQRRLLRASSERLARGAERNTSGNSQQPTSNDKHKNKLRARSDYGISMLYKKPDVVKISVNDINDQILGKNRVRSTLSAEDPAIAQSCESPNIEFRTRFRESELESGELKESKVEVEKTTKGYFPKSALKSNQGRWPNSGITFWSSSATVPGTTNIRTTPRINQRFQGGKTERTVSRETNTAPPDVYLRRDGIRVKLNVNELPRSKTPIADNDPDKLNMQHVIAFLQSSGSADENNIKRDLEVLGEPVAKPRPSQMTHSPGKRSAINGVITASPDQNGLISIRPPEGVSSVSPGKTSRLPSDEEQETTPHRLSFNKMQLGEERGDRMSEKFNGNSIKPGTESMELYKKTRTMLNNQGGILQYSDFKSHSMNLSEKDGTKSTGYPNLQDIHIPISIRKFRDNAHGSDSKPFRLHRFLTLVSNNQDQAHMAFEKIERSAGGPEQSKNLGSRDKRRAFRKGSGPDKVEKRHSHQRRYHPDSNLYYLDVSTPFIDRPRSKGGSRGSSKSRQDDMDDDQIRRDVQRIIKLPRAHYEADSDEEGSPYCTVPAARNKRALTLSAQGRAIKNIISENKKLSASLHNTDNQSFQNNTSSNNKAADTQSIKKTNPDSDIVKIKSLGETGEVEARLTEPEPISDKNLNPLTKEQNLKEDYLEAPLTSTKRQEITEDQASAVTFRDMLDLKSDPGVDAVSNDASAQKADSSGTALLTQVSPSLSLSHSDQNWLSPNNNGQTKISPTGGFPLSKRGGTAKGNSFSPTRDHVKLSLRKEKNKTRELTYMFQVDHDGVESLSPSPK